MLNFSVEDNENCLLENKQDYHEHYLEKKPTQHIFLRS